MGNVKPKPSDIGNGLDMVDYVLCLKASDKVRVTYFGSEKQTVVNFILSNGDVTSCQFVLQGNPYHLHSKVPKTFQVEPHKSSENHIDAGSALLTGFVFGELDAHGHFQPIYVADKLKGFSATDFINALTNSPLDQSYMDFVALFDGNTKATGTGFDDHFDTGTGKDTINGLGGNDTVNFWAAGDLTFNGGAGFDTLDFESAIGVYFPTAKTQPLILDLQTGIGQNPYGGTLKVSSVEKVIGTDAADKILGSSKADWIETQDYGGDTINGRGGDDTVVLWPFANGAQLDGGKGRDTLQTAFEYQQNTLDLTDPSQNTGKFENGWIKNFEVFKFSSTSTDPTTLLTFRAGAGSETVTMSGGATVILYLGDGDNKATGGGGDDTIVAGSGKDRLDGGAGDDFLTGGDNADTFVFSPNNGHDVIKDFDPSGAAHDKIDLSAIADITGWSDLKKHHLDSVDGNAEIVTGEDSSIILTGVKAKDLAEEDFTFA